MLCLGAVVALVMHHVARSSLRWRFVSAWDLVDRLWRDSLGFSDVFGRLNDFAEAYVLLYEIEHEIRDLIHDVYDDGELSEVLNAMLASARRPAAEVVEELQHLVKQKGTIPAVGKAMRLLRAELSGRLESLEDFTFAQYRNPHLLTVGTALFRDDQPWVSS